MVAETGIDVFIDEMVRIKNPHLVKIGNHVAIDFGFYCTTKLIIGDYCHVSAHVSVIGGKDALFIMGNFSHLAAGARMIVFGDKNLGAGLVSPVVPAQYRDEMYGGVIELESFVSVLTNAVIAPNVIIPQGCIIGANSFITEKNHLEPWEIWAGTPAKKIGVRPKETMLRYAYELGYDY